MFALKDILKNKGNSAIIIIMMIISLCGFNIVSNLLFNSFIQSIESKAVADSNEVLSIIFDKGQTTEEIDKLIDTLTNDGMSIAYSVNSSFKGNSSFKDDLFDTSFQINVISNENMFNYNLISGRNINNDDIRNGNKVAVISKTYEYFCREENNKLYIDIDNDTYEVVGITGNKYSTSYYDLKVFIPYTSIPKNWENNNEILQCSFLISGNDISIDKYKENFHIKLVNYSHLQHQTIAHNLFMIMQDVIYFSLIALISIINIIIFSVYWINKKNPQIGILKAIGYSNKNTTILIANELLILSIISSVCATLLYIPFSQFFNEHFFDIGLQGSIVTLLFDFIFSFVCSLIIVSFNKKRVDQLSISNGMVSSVNFSKQLWIKIVLVIQVLLVLNFSVVAFDTMNYVFSTMNKAKKIVNIENIQVVDPFTVSYEKKVLPKYDVEKTLGGLKDDNLTLINYLYSVDSSKDVKSMGNISKDYYDPNYSDNYFERAKSEDVIPIIYIERDSFKALKLNISVDEINDDYEDVVPVYAGYDYKKHFSIGDTIKGDSGYNYEIKGFLAKDMYMFNDNNSSQALSQTNNLNSFIIIPYNVESIKKLPLGYSKEDFIHYSMANSFFVYKTQEAKDLLQDTLKAKGIETTSLKNQLDGFTLINFNDVSYKLFNVIIILFIAICGLIGFSISSVFSEKREIGIKIALGFSKRFIIKEYMYRIMKLAIISLIIITIKYCVFSYIKLTLKMFIGMVGTLLIIIIPSIILVSYLINKYVPSELIGGEK